MPAEKLNELKAQGVQFTKARDGGLVVANLDKTIARLKNSANVDTGKDWGWGWIDGTTQFLETQPSANQVDKADLGGLIVRRDLGVLGDLESHWMTINGGGAYRFLTYGGQTRVFDGSTTRFNDWGMTVSSANGLPLRLSLNRSSMRLRRSALLSPGAAA